MYKIFLLILVLLVGCTLPSKKALILDKTTVIKSAQVKPDNWANEYYNATIFVVNNPIVENSYKELLKICGGEDFLFNTAYQAKKPALIPYKKQSITIKTKSGFVKKVFISKGACREISLYKAPKSPQSKLIRNKISMAILQYLY
jgi:hypothetical protein